MNWQDYYERFYEWAESTQISRMSSLMDFGPSAEIVEIAEMFADEKIAARLIKKALAARVNFSPAEILELADYIDDETLTTLLKTCRGKYSREQIESLGDYGIDDELLESIAKQSDVRTEEDNEDDDESYFADDTYDADAAAPPERRPGLLGALLAFAGFLGEKKAPAHNGRCNGDCAHCPPHYGYRYGRWYFGHDHVHGCEFGGNKGSGKMD